jgi:hypothetical protein
MAYNHENYGSDSSRRPVVPSNGIPQYPRTIHPVQETGELSTPYPTMNLATTPVSSHNNHYARGYGNFGYSNNPQFLATVPSYLDEATVASDHENIQYFAPANRNTENHVLHSTFLAQGPPYASQVPMVQQAVNYASSASEITSPGFSLPSPYDSSVNTPLSQISGYGNEESMTIVSPFNIITQWMSKGKANYNSLDTGTFSTTRSSTAHVSPSPASCKGPKGDVQKSKGLDTI